MVNFFKYYIMLKKIDSVFDIRFLPGLSNWRNLQVIRDLGGNLALHGINPPYQVEYFHNVLTVEESYDGQANVLFFH